MMEIYITCFLEILSSSSRCRRFETENFFRRATMVDNNMSKLVAPPPEIFSFLRAWQEMLSKKFQ